MPAQIWQKWWISSRAIIPMLHGVFVTPSRLTQTYSGGILKPAAQAGFAERAS